jgi:hypothetical protein
MNAFQHFQAAVATKLRQVKLDLADAAAKPADEALPHGGDALGEQFCGHGIPPG